MFDFMSHKDRRPIGYNIIHNNMRGGSSVGEQWSANPMAHCSILGRVSCQVHSHGTWWGTFHAIYSLSGLQLLKVHRCMGVMIKPCAQKDPRFRFGKAQGVTLGILVSRLNNRVSECWRFYAIPTARRKQVWTYSVLVKNKFGLFQSWVIEYMR